MGIGASMSAAQIAGATFSDPGLDQQPFTAAAVGLGDITMDGVAVATMRTFSMALSNGLRTQQVIGQVSLAGIALGKLDLSGDLELYFETVDKYQAFLDADAFALACTFTSALGDTYEVTYPRVKYEDMDLLSGGLDQDIMVKGKWRALYDSATGCMIQIVKTPHV